MGKRKKLTVINMISTTGRDGVYHPQKDYGPGEMDYVRQIAPDKKISDEVATEEALEKLRRSILRVTQEAFNQAASIEEVQA